MRRLSFTREFKLETVKLIQERGVSAARASRDLESAFYTMWQRRVSGCAPGSFAAPAA
jgi:transposase-like protein